MMHCLDHNGQTGIIVAGVLCMLVHDSRLGANMDQRMALINAKLKQFNTDYPSSAYLNELRIKFFFESTTTWAELGGSVIKAANTRRLLPSIQLLCAEYLSDTRDAFHCAMTELVEQACRLYHILYGAGMFLREDELTDLADCSSRLGLSLMQARHLASLQGLMYFQVTHKCHWAQHFLYQAHLLNPRFVQVYGAESFIGVITRIWHSSAHGPYQAKVQGTVSLKMLVLVCLELGL